MVAIEWCAWSARVLFLHQEDITSGTMSAAGKSGRAAAATATQGGVLLALRRVVLEQYYF
jgi:hypothetical protein